MADARGGIAPHGFAALRFLDNPRRREVEAKAMVTLRDAKKAGDDGIADYRRGRRLERRSWHPSRRYSQPHKHACRRFINIWAEIWCEIWGEIWGEKFTVLRDRMYLQLQNQ